MPEHQREKISQAQKTRWERLRAENKTPVRSGRAVSDETKARISASLRETIANSPGLYAKSPEHREKIRQGKLEHEKKFTEYTCIIDPCDQKTRHWQKICTPHRRMKYRCEPYGLTPQELVTMYEEQRGTCGICTRSLRLTGHRLIDPGATMAAVIDHCHKTRVTRGLLCHLCNRSLGMLQDSAANLQRAINYLEKVLDCVPE